MSSTETEAPDALLGLCLAGPTCAGKTALAMAFARHLARDSVFTPRMRGASSAAPPSTDHDGAALEIISVDSALVYRGMDIGTAKPSAAERAEVRHHLIDILEPHQAYSAAAFAADACRIAGEIRARGRLPLLVGGTMLYFKALREGLDEMPAADAHVRAAIDAEAAQRGWPALHVELARVDRASAARLAPNDAQRIQRALEVWRVSGRPLSAWHRGAGTNEGAPSQRHRWPLVSLEPVSRAWLHERIARRFAAMLEEGLLDEVRALRARGDLHAALPSMRCVGYRQAWAALERGQSDALAAQGVAATRQLAKRQLTWLRSMPDRQVLPCDAADVLAQGIAALQEVAHRRARTAPSPRVRPPPVPGL